LTQRPLAEARAELARFVSNTHSLDMKDPKSRVNAHPWGGQLADPRRLAGHDGGQVNTLETALTLSLMAQTAEVGQHLEYY
jgi:hypothetical protein